jgi:hypothetical protein
MNYA